MTTYLDEARKRYPTSRIIGDGRWLVTNQSGSPVYLTLTEQQQLAIALGIDGPVFANLHTIDFDKIRDVYDPDEARRERRAKKAEEKQ